MQSCESCLHKIGGPISPVEFVQRLMLQVIEVDTEHFEIFGVLGMCNKMKSKFDVAICVPPVLNS